MFNFFKRGDSHSAISVIDAEQRLGQADAPLFLDVREPAEFQQGHITGSVLIPLGDLAQRAEELARDHPIIVVCRSGNRSGMATSLLKRLGYDAVNMRGGMIDWSRHGLPIERGT